MIFFRRVAGFGVILSRSISPTELRISSTCHRAFLPFATHAMEQKTECSNLKMHLQARIVKVMGDNVTGYFQNYFPRAI